MDVKQSKHNAIVSVTHLCHISYDLIIFLRDNMLNQIQLDSRWLMGRGRQNPHNKNKTTEDAEIKDSLEVRKIHREHTGNTQERL
jgi:hypothetical protein